MIQNYREHIGLTKEDLNYGYDNIDLNNVRLHHFKHESISRTDVNRAKLITFNNEGCIRVLKSRYKEIKLSL